MRTADIKILFCYFAGNNLAEGRADQLLPPNMVTEGGNKPPFDSRQMPMPMLVLL